MPHFTQPSYLGTGKLPTLDELRTHQQRKKRNKELHALQEIIRSKTVVSESEFAVLELTGDSSDDDIRKCLNNLINK